MAENFSRKDFGYPVSIYKDAFGKINAIEDDYAKSQIEYWQNKSWFDLSVENIPESEIDYIIGLIESANHIKIDTNERKDFAKLLAFLRLTNSMCHHCHTDENSETFILCANCHLVWWCNETCKEKDKDDHLKWCRVKNAPLDHELFLPEIGQPK